LDNDTTRGINPGQIFLCFSLPWLVYFFVSLTAQTLYYYGGTLRETVLAYLHHPWFWWNFLPAALLFAAGTLINRVIRKPTGLPNKSNGLVDAAKVPSWRRLLPAALLLIGVETVIHSLLDKYHDQVNIPVVEGWLTIVPVVTSQTENGFISMGQLDDSLRMPLVALGSVLFCFVLRFLYFFEEKKTLLTIGGTLYAAGAGCSILLGILRDNCYDYIKIYPLAWCNAFDIYLYVSVCLILQSLAQNYGVLKKVSWRDIVKDYLPWERAWWRARLSSVRQFGGKGKCKADAR